MAELLVDMHYFGIACSAQNTTIKQNAFFNCQVTQCGNRYQGQSRFSQTFLVVVTLQTEVSRQH